MITEAKVNLLDTYGIDAGQVLIMRVRDFHKLAIIRREARGNTTAVPSKKLYRRKEKHKPRW